MPSNQYKDNNNSDTVQTQVYGANMDPSYSHFRHVLALLGRQRWNAGNSVGLQTLYHGEGAAAGRRAAPQDRCWSQAEQAEHQQQDASPGLRSHAREHDLLGSGRWSGHLCSSPSKKLLVTLALRWRSGPDTEQQLCRAAGGAGERWASGDTEVVVVLLLVGWSLPPSLLHHGEREGHRNRGQSHQTPLEVRVGMEGRVGRERDDEDASAEEEDEEMRYKTVINYASSDPTDIFTHQRRPVAATASEVQAFLLKRGNKRNKV